MFSLGSGRASISSPLAIGLAVLLAEAPDPAGVEVAVDVDADQLGQCLAAVDVAAGDALAVVLAVARSGLWGYSTIGGEILAAGSGRCRRWGWNGWKPSLMLQP